ncbi:hypothetical protein [Helicobacter sp.]|uniref:hypothetical protein n=1 Tax=Helicobacter sp. TaxID=218 RepID=UPI0025C613C5|nr:hypothetical protein [Helicobacter sp.]MBR2495040.1 hypothetical protein [Helicobacter sp.]
MSNLDKTIHPLVAMLLFFIFGFVYTQAGGSLLHYCYFLSAVYGYCPLYKRIKSLAKDSCSLAIQSSKISP